MMINNDVQQGGVRGSGQGRGVTYSPVHTPLPARRPPTEPRRRLLRTVFVGTLIVVIVAGAVTLAAVAYTAGNQISVSIEDQQTALIDLRQGSPISPYLLGTNVFPETGTLSADQTSGGFMSYGSHITNGLRSAHIKLLRFPGGDWGELHAYSFEQLNAFSNLLAQVNADGMIQVSLSTPGPLAGGVEGAGRYVSLAGGVVE